MTNTLSPDQQVEILGSAPFPDSGTQNQWLNNLYESGYLMYPRQCKNWREVCGLFEIEVGPTQSGRDALTRAMYKARHNQKSTVVSNPSFPIKTISEPMSDVMTATMVAPTNESATNAANLLQQALASLMPTVTIDENTVVDLIKKYAVDEDKIQSMIDKIPTKYVGIEIKTPTESKKIEGVFHKSLPTIIKLVSVGIRPYLYGPAGTGKTHIGGQVAEALGLRFVSQSICNQTPMSFFLGYMTAHGEYSPTEFYKCYTEGGLYLLDEMDNGNANCLAVLNSAIENKQMAFPNGMVQKHPDFRIIASANTFGTGATEQYIGRNPIDAATQNRFMKIKFGYDENVEKSLFSIEACEMVWNARKKLEGKTGWVMSMRDISRAHDLFELGFNRDEVYQMAIVDQLSSNLASCL
jgi:hypothetical protein